MLMCSWGWKVARETTKLNASPIAEGGQPAFMRGLLSKLPCCLTACRYSSQSGNVCISMEWNSVVQKPAALWKIKKRDIWILLPLTKLLLKQCLHLFSCNRYSVTNTVQTHTQFILINFIFRLPSAVFMDLHLESCNHMFLYCPPNVDIGYHHLTLSHHNFQFQDTAPLSTQADATP